MEHVTLSMLDIGIIVVYLVGIIWYGIHFLHKAPLLLLACVVVHVVVSSLTRPPAQDVVNSLTWNPGLFRAETRELAHLPWYQNYRVLSVLLLVVTALVVGYFW